MLYKLPKIKLPKIKLSKAAFPEIKRTKDPSVKKRKSKQWFLLFLILSVFLASLSGFLAGAIAVNRFVYGQRTSLFDFQGFESLFPAPKIEEQEAAFVSEEEMIIAAVKKVSPSVVSIIITKDLPIMETYYYNPFEEFKEFFGDNFGIEIPQQRQNGTERTEIGGGTGFIVSEDGLILTNKHVVLDEEADYTVLTNEGESFDAQVLARDPFQDIAILKIETDRKLPVVELADSDKLQIGQSVIAIGNVLGEFRNSVSVGIVSGLGRTITASSGDFSEVLDNIIQTDAAINKGNSGGPLLNLRGEVIGINTAVDLTAENVGFAIPIGKAKRDIVQVKETGEISYPFLGVYYVLITPSLQEEYELGIGYGAWVGHDRLGEETNIAVFPDSAADKAGLRRDDVILELNGEKIDLENTLARIIDNYFPGDKAALKIWRNGEEMMLEAVLGKR